MRRGGTGLWGGVADLIVLVIPTFVVQAQDTGGTITLPELSVSAQADRAFFVPDTASQGVITGKAIEEQPRSRVEAVLKVVPGLICVS